MIKKESADVKSATGSVSKRFGYLGNYPTLLYKQHTNSQMLIMALNGVCGKTSSEDTLKYIIGGRESYLLVTNLPPSIHFQLCTTYILKTLPSTRKEFLTVSCFLDILWQKESDLFLCQRSLSTKINADIKVSKVDFPQHFLTRQYIPAYDQGHTY